MAKGFRALQRDQPMLLPPDLRSWLPDRHLALLVLDVVDRLDLSPTRSSYRLGAAGRQAYDPAMLIALLIYAMCTGMRSSRGIERACVTDVAFRVISAQQFPDHTTIARFRQRHREGLAELFGQVLALCHQAGMGQVGTVAVDSVKIAADASSRKNYTAGKYRQMQKDHDERQAKYRAMAEAMLDEAEAVDAAEDDEHGPGNSGDELPAELAPGPDRGRRIQERLDKLAAETADAIAEAVSADVELAQAKLARAQRAEANVRDRAQARHETRPARPGRRRPIEEHKTVQEAAAGVARAQAELKTASAGGGPAAKKRAAATETKATCNFTDPDSRIMPLPNKGWIQGFNAQLAVTGDHLIIATAISTATNDGMEFVPMMNAAVASATHHLPGKTIGMLLADAGYCSEAALTAPGPDRLIATGRDPAKDPAHPERMPARAAMAQRLSEGSPDRATYKRRAATVEPVIGHLKDRIGFTRFSSRGKQAAEHELAFAATCLNIRRLFTVAPRLAN